jgi:hypothetical protein
VLLALLRHAEGKAFNRSLVFLATKTGDRYVEVLSRFLESCSQADKLAHAIMRCGSKNAKLVSIATPMCRLAFK